MWSFNLLSGQNKGGGGQNYFFFVHTQDVKTVPARRGVKQCHASIHVPDLTCTQIVVIYREKNR